jgi:hypothetical protein
VDDKPPTEAASSDKWQAVPMDWKTRATLWIAALVLGSYFALAFLNCALDTACQLRCASTGGVDTAYHSSGACVYQKAAPKALNVGEK